MSRNGSHDNDSPGRTSWAVRFSEMMEALDPGVQVMLRWFMRIALLIALIRIPGAVSSMELSPFYDYHYYSAAQSEPDESVSH